MQIRCYLFALLVAFSVQVSFASSYVISPAPGVTAKLLINGTKNAIVAPGDQGPSTTFDAGLFSEGVITVSMPTAKGIISNTCHITFLNDDKWIPSVFKGDVCGFLITSKDNIVRLANPVSVISTDKPSQFASYIPDRTYMVDYNAKTGNMFFRGNMPLTTGFKNQRIDFKDMIPTMKQKFAEQVPNATFPKKFLIIDISIINNNLNGELLPVYAEYVSMKGKGGPDALVPNRFQPTIAEKGQPVGQGGRARLLWWPIEPVLESQIPFDNDSSKVDRAMKLTGNLLVARGKDTHVGTLTDLVNKIENIMATKNDVPVIIYLHCTDGRDRTSIVSVSYLMQHYKMPFHDAFVYGSTILKDNQRSRYTPITQIGGHLNTMRWMCLYLKQKPGYEKMGDCNAPFDDDSIIDHYPWED